MKFQLKPVIIDAVRWFPGECTYKHIEPYRNKFEHHFENYSDSECVGCSLALSKHGWINDGTDHGARVCPGYWVATWPNGALRVYSPEDFEKLCRPVQAPDKANEDYFLSGGWRK